MNSIKCFSLVFFLFLIFLGGAFAECTWTKTKSGGTWESFGNFMKASNGTIYMIGSNLPGPVYDLYKSTDNGSSWQKINEFAAYISANLLTGSGSQLLVTGSNYLYSYGSKNTNNNKVIFYSSDWGLNWTLTNPLGDVGGIQFLEANGKIFAATNKDVSLFYSNPGQASWVARLDHQTGTFQTKYSS